MIFLFRWMFLIHQSTFECQRFWFVKTAAVLSKTMTYATLFFVAIQDCWFHQFYILIYFMNIWYFIERMEIWPFSTLKQCLALHTTIDGNNKHFEIRIWEKEKEKINLYPCEIYTVVKLNSYREFTIILSSFSVTLYTTRNIL